MTKLDVIGTIAIIATWVLIIGAGTIIWNCDLDAFEGIIMGLVISVLVIIVTGGLQVTRDDEYNEWGEYRS